MSESTLPPIFTATTQHPDAPANMRACAWMPGDKPGRHWTTTGPTEAEAMAKLAEFWLKVEAERPRKPPVKKAEAGETPAAEDDDIGDVV